jgi:hypothetical protein
MRKALYGIFAIGLLLAGDSGAQLAFNQYPIPTAGGGL